MTGTHKRGVPVGPRSRWCRPGPAAAFGLVLIGSASTWAADGDPGRGRAVYDRCIGCHALDRNRTGPRHCGLLGRRAGSVPGFRYSKAMRQSEIVWSRPTLEAFIADPLSVVPGTRMGYAGVKDARDRADLIAYIVAAQSDPAVCP